ncbi:MAG: acetyl-CoA carboxylase, biotin carboxyl carrier protein, partial [Paenibacillaceae bacterium]|jgi:acetyl-CoA carboxylase biotin carboxyl carrier protein|nr:acetyl-CoA carboxylase, biotin carboxyl carrier protein [Paenibacillaceae bacterium]
MFKLSEIKELIRLVDQSNLQELEIQNEGYKLYLKKPGVTESLLVTHTPAYQAVPASIPVQAEAVKNESAQEKEPQSKQEDEGQLHRIVSPMVGTYYHAPTPEASSFVKAGDRVTEKTVVCIVEAMKLMNEIEAEVKGEIVQVLVENGQLVEYGQPLFLVRV